jgi:hypothetical protein
MRITVKNNILIVHFNGNKNKMNELLDIISNNYEGIIKNREGHNFPSQFIPKNHLLSKYINECKYVIGIYNNKDIKHEMLHAKYYIDKDYYQKINKEWNEIEPNIKEYLTKFLKKLGYSESVIIDEYQAYRYSESDNFFGIKII